MKLKGNVDLSYVIINLIFNCLIVNVIATTLNFPYWAYILTFILVALEVWVRARNKYDKRKILSTCGKYKIGDNVVTKRKVMNGFFEDSHVPPNTDGIIASNGELFTVNHDQKTKDYYYNVKLQWVSQKGKQRKLTAFLWQGDLDIKNN